MFKRKKQPTIEPPNEASEARDAARKARLSQDLKVLAGEIGERNYILPEKLEAAATFLEGALSQVGYTPKRQVYQAKRQEFANIEVEIKGSSRPDEIVIIGAHYDSAQGTPGADDNGTGVVALLELARVWAKAHAPARTLRFVLFVNEEPPFFQTEEMGSLVYARRCAANKEKVVAMLSLEMLGYYDDAKGSQQYPPGLGLMYPDKGDFIGFVTRMGSSSLNASSERAFKGTVKFPTERLAAPELVTGVGFSDHWSFWQAGYDAIMVTDTAFMRNPHYHEPTDTPETIDYERLTRVVNGLEGTLKALVDP